MWKWTLQLKLKVISDRILAKILTISFVLHNVQHQHVVQLQTFSQLNIHLKKMWRNFLLELCNLNFQNVGRSCEGNHHTLRSHQDWTLSWAAMEDVVLHWDSYLVTVSVSKIKVSLKNCALSANQPNWFNICIQISLSRLTKHIRMAAWLYYKGAHH